MSANYPAPYRLLAAAFAHMGRLDEARDVVRRLQAMTPAVVPLNLQFRNPKHRELLLSGLRRATGEVE
jgi:adenylate cyclase